MSLSAPKLLAVWVPIYTSMEAQTCPQTLLFDLLEGGQHSRAVFFFTIEQILSFNRHQTNPITMADEDEQPKTVYEFKDGEQETSEWCSRAGL